MEALIKLEIPKVDVEIMISVFEAIILERTDILKAKSIKHVCQEYREQLHRALT